MEFLAVTDYTNDTIIDTFGLSVDKDKQAPNYITALRRDKLIEQKTVFLHLNPDSTWNDTETDKGAVSIIEFGRHRSDEVRESYIDGEFYNHHYGYHEDTELNRPLMVLNLTSAHVKGDEFVKNSKAVIATNQKRVFVFGGSD